MATRSERIPAHIAARVARNTRKHFSSLHSEALTEIEMNDSNVNLNMRSQKIGGPEDDKTLGNPGAVAGSSVTSGMAAAPNSQVRPITVKPVDRKTIEGSYPGDFRTGNVDRVVLPDNPGPREPKGQSKVTSSKLNSPAPQLSEVEG